VPAGFGDDFNATLDQPLSLPIIPERINGNSLIRI
jgi:hypothetical protein